MVLMSPLGWRSELVLLFPAYIFASMAALRLATERRALPGMGFVAGTTLIATCAVVELVKALPDFRPQTLTAVLTFIGTAIILKSWIDAAPLRHLRQGEQSSLPAESGAAGGLTA